MKLAKLNPSKYVFQVLATLVIGATIVAGVFLQAGEGGEVMAEQTIGEHYFTYTPGGLEQSREQSSATLLNFYATWCGSCNAFEPTIKSVMEEIGARENIRGYRVNFGDNNESKEGRELAKEYGVTVQTTTIILNKNGKVFKSYFTPVPEEELKQTLLAAAISE